MISLWSQRSSPPILLISEKIWPALSVGLPVTSQNHLTWLLSGWGQHKSKGLQTDWPKSTQISLQVATPTHVCKNLPVIVISIVGDSEVMTKHTKKWTSSGPRSKMHSFNEYILRMYFFPENIRRQSGSLTIPSKKCFVLMWLIIWLERMESKHYIEKNKYFYIIYIVY